jgi:hypothetical protein
VNGVLLKRNLEPAKGLKEFLEYVTKNHDVFWLTTHCKGDTEHVMHYLKRHLPTDVFELTKTIKPTDWDVLKTDGIDFNKDFRWLDDNLMESEKKVLIQNNSLEKQVFVDLERNPDQLMKTLSNSTFFHDF